LTVGKAPASGSVTLAGRHRGRTGCRQTIHDIKAGLCKILRRLNRRLTNPTALFPAYPYNPFIATALLNLLVSFYRIPVTV
ncbi:hypothetical protein, partial [Escherichia coli]|uniref:hypothetical protein n=1 Tax=Escherichia coli TaxID=562 RepID=UPI00390CD4ED